MAARVLEGLAVKRRQWPSDRVPRKRPELCQIELRDALACEVEAVAAASGKTRKATLEALLEGDFAALAKPSPDQVCAAFGMERTW